MSTSFGPLSDTSAATRSAPPPEIARGPLTVYEFYSLMRARWRLLGRAAIVGAVIGLALAFLLPVEYTAITTLLPPAPSSSLASAFAAQSGELGALAAGLASSSLGIRNPADLCMIILRSRTVEDAVIHRFDLMHEYHRKRLSDTRTSLEHHTTLTLNLKSGLIAIAARDHDAARAADLANGYVDEFRKFSAGLAVTEAGQRRLFFEQQLRQANGTLTDAEEALKHTQQKTGLLDPVGEARASMESGVVLRAQIAAREVELHAMSSYATDANPRVIELKQEIAGLEAQEAQLTGASPDIPDDAVLPKGRIPEAGAEYLRRLRDVKYNEALVAILSRQLEIARLDEARQGAVVQVVDLAVTPDKRSFPKRTATLLGSIALALCAAGFWILYSRREPSQAVRRFTTHAALVLLIVGLSTRFAGAQSAVIPSAGTQSLSPDCTETGESLPGVPCSPDELGAQLGQSRPYFPSSRLLLQPNLQGTPLEDRDDLNRLYQRELYRQRMDRATRPPEPHTEFEQMAADSAGYPLAVFGHSFFEQPPDTFAPATNIQVPSDYIVGPGDELRIRVWGPINSDLRIEVDRAGQVYIPQVGEIPVAGVRYSELESTLTQAVGRVFKSFNLSVAIGRLHLIQVFVVGQAKAPGTYTIGSLSTLVNAVFASGGPLPQGSLRRIELRRGARTVQQFDLYDLLVNGDKSHDIPLQSGDVVLIPPVGSLAAISGSVNAPAIYELRDGETLGALIETAGGLSSVANGSSATVERISEGRARTVLQFPLDAVGLATALKGGDVVHISSVVPRFDDTVTLRGYVANPGRYPFTPGMHVRDLLPNAEALLSREYWLNRANSTDGRQTEYPVRKKVVEVPRPVSSQDQQTGAAGVDQQQFPDQQQALQTSQSPFAPPGIHPQSRQQTIPEYYRDLARSESTVNPDVEVQARQSSDRVTQTDTLTQDLRKLVPSVNWRYAVVQRVNLTTLQAELIAFDLGKAVVDGDPGSNLALAPGDIVTVFSQKDITVPQQAQTRYVKVEGEVEHPGVYELNEGQTLKDALEAAGGLTAKAYPYGAHFTRESARVEQQKGLDEMIRTAEAEMRASTVNAVASSTQDANSVGARQTAQQALLGSLRLLRASGRVVLAMKPDASSIADFPAIALEDGDKIVIPAHTDTVTVSGAVYNPASFVYNPRRRVGDYLQLAGKGGLNANQRHAFVLRADGSVFSRQEAGGLFHGGFDSLPMYPGDQIIVPEKVDNGVVRALHDWPQILAPLAVTALAIATVANQ